jgi:peroxiredoxin
LENGEITNLGMSLNDGICGNSTRIFNQKLKSAQSIFVYMKVIKKKYEFLLQRFLRSVSGVGTDTNRHRPALTGTRPARIVL